MYVIISKKTKYQRIEVVLINTKRRSNILNLNPSQVLVIGFASLILLGTILLNLPIASKDGQSVGLINSFFTATSSVCVTGLVVVDTATHWTVFAQTVILFLIQIGGIGFMTMATLLALLLGKKISLKERLVMQEALNQFSISGIVRLTKYIFFTTLLIEGLGAIMLSIRFIPMYGTWKGIGFSIFHSISAFCNAGFDLIGHFRSLTPFANDVLVNVTMWILIITGGLGYTVIIDIIRKRKFQKLSLHSKMALYMTITLLSVTFLAIFLLEFNNTETIGGLSIKGKFLTSIFHSITTRTAGFNTLSTENLTMASILFTMIMMFIGGSPAGTAGGVKTTTIGVLIWTIISNIKGKEDTEMFERRIPRETINRALAVVGIGIALVIFVTMILSITEENYDFIELFFETVSAFGTVGLSLGVTPNLSSVGKIVIAITMFTGRVGPLTFAIALARKHRNTKTLIRYPEEKIIVG